MQPGPPTATITDFHGNQEGRHAPNPHATPMIVSMRRLTSSFTGRRREASWSEHVQPTAPVHA
jgi:hypothetical protein